MTPFHLLSWCAMPMCYFLDAYVICNNSLVPLYNTLVPCNVNTEARDLRDTLVMGCLRLVDKFDALVTMLFMA